MEKDNSRRKYNLVVSERFLFEKNAYPVKPQDVTVQLCTDSDGALPSKYRGKKNRTKMLLGILSTSDQPLLNLPDLEWFALAQKTFQHMGWDSRSNGSPGEAMKETILSSIVAKFKLSMFLFVVVSCFLLAELILLVELFDHMPCKYKPLCW